MGTSKLMIPVPLFHLKFLDGIRGLRCRNFKWAALAIGAAALLAVPAITPAQARAPGQHMHRMKHHWRHHAGPAWYGEPAQPAVTTYTAGGPVCPQVGHSFDCKIWPPPYEDDPDRKVSKH